MKAEQGTRLWLFQKKEEKAPWKKFSFSYASPYTHSLRRISRRVFCSVNMQIECENGGGQREVSCAISKRGRKEEEEEMVWRFHKGKKLPPFAASGASFPAIFLFSSTSTSRCYSSPFLSILPPFRLCIHTCGGRVKFPPIFTQPILSRPGRETVSEKKRHFEVFWKKSAKRGRDLFNAHLSPQSFSFPPVSSPFPSFSFSSTFGLFLAVERRRAARAGN